MNHTPEQLANAMFLDKEKFVTYAMEHESDTLNDDGTIGTWYVDEVIQRYKSFIGQDTYDNDRVRIVEEVRHRLRDI